MNEFNTAYNIIGEGESIIFIHGIGSRKYSWNGVIKELVDNYKCVTYDLRGHGDSKNDKNKFVLNDLVEDVEKLRSYLDINKVHLVGHSVGGMIGPCYARKYKKNVESVTLLSTAAFRPLESKKKLLDIIKDIEKNGIENALPLLVDRWFTDNFIKNNQEIINKRISQIRTTPLDIFLNVFKIYALTEMSSWLKDVNVPCLVMTGENDVGCNPGINRKISNALSISKLEILNNLKHAITLESPELVGKKIKEFIKAL